MNIYKSENSEVYCTKEAHDYSLDFLTDNSAKRIDISFQDGPAKDFGRNGWQNEEIIAILVDRIKNLNTTFPCRENSVAITKLEEALMWLEKRTNDRKARGVEGQNLI